MGARALKAATVRWSESPLFTDRANKSESDSTLSSSSLLSFEMCFRQVESQGQPRKEGERDIYIFIYTPLATVVRVFSFINKRGSIRTLSGCLTARLWNQHASLHSWPTTRKRDVGDLCDNRRGVRNDTLSTRQSDGTPCDFLCLSDTDGI